MQVKQQSGLALLMLLLLLLAAGLYGFSLQPSALPLQTERSYQVLKQAKQLLLAYAASYHSGGSDWRPVRPGELPCPDFDGDGRISPLADYRGSHCRSRLGWLPWQSLQALPLHDGSGAQLWYAVSAGFYNHAAINEPALNPDTPLSLTLDGHSLVAVLLAPGKPGAGQSARSPADTSANSEQYLESVETEDHFSLDSAQSNDVLLGVSRAEWLEAVAPAVLAQVLASLNGYFTDNGVYPWAAVAGGECDAGSGRLLGSLPASCQETAALRYPGVTAAGGWLLRNQWPRYITYRLSADRQAVHLQLARQGRWLRGGVLSRE